jgi:hypothetical protein
MPRPQARVRGAARFESPSSVATGWREVPGESSALRDPSPAVPCSLLIPEPCVRPAARVLLSRSSTPLRRHIALRNALHPTSTCNAEALQMVLRCSEEPRCCPASGFFRLRHRRPRAILAATLRHGVELALGASGNVCADHKACHSPTSRRRSGSSHSIARRTRRGDAPQKWGCRLVYCRCFATGWGQSFTHPPSRQD